MAKPNLRPVLNQEMGFCKKSQIDGGITLRNPLRPINTNKIIEKEATDSEEQGGGSTTPTSVEARIPQRLPCPLAPRKRRPSLKCHLNGVKEFFNPPELESVFKRVN